MIGIYGHLSYIKFYIHRLNNFWNKKIYQNIPKVSKHKTWICCVPDIYLHSIYIILIIISNLEMI